MEQKQTKTVNICAVMTAGRYENTFCRNHIERALKRLGIPFTVSLGVYYGQCMQKMMEKAVADGGDYLVTIDGDTLFKPEQLQRLISIIAQEEEIDALAAIQIRRGKADMLGSKLTGNRVDWYGYPIKMDTAHFGLTVIDLKKLATVEKPWFFCKPDDNGEWSDDRTDSDVWFWRQWAKAGLSVYVDPDTRVGHMEEMVVMYGDDLKPTHVYPNEWVEAPC